MFISIMSGCANQNTKSSISSTELDKLIQTSEAPLILDTRSSSEYESGHLPGAQFLPFWKAFSADESILERCKSEPVIIYCQHGPRASFAKFALKSSGCTNIVQLEGHMANWIKQGLPISVPDDVKTK